MSRCFRYAAIAASSAVTVVSAACAPASPAARPTLAPPSPHSTFPFPTSTPVPVTSADDKIIEYEPGPLWVILSSVDDHGRRGQPLIELARQPDAAAPQRVGSVPSGSFAQVLEIRRLPPDYLRAFYRVRTTYQSRDYEGWVADWYARRTAYVIAFDDNKCACPFAVQLWADSALTQPAAAAANRSPLRLLTVDGESVQVQVLRDGTIGWVSAALVHESDENEFLKYIAP